MNTLSAPTARHVLLPAAHGETFRRRHVPADAATTYGVGRREIPPAAVTALTFILVIVIGWFDYKTGDFSLALFYLVPVSLATWYGGCASGWFIGLSSAAAWFIGDLTLNNHSDNPLLPYWNAVTPALIYGIVVQLLSAMRHLQMGLQDRLAQRTVSLTETHHRVKNNLHVISSLLMLQSEKVVNPEDRAVFVECRDRLRTMARLHENLFSQRDSEEVDFAAHLQEISRMLVHAHAPFTCEISLKFETAPIAIDLDAAMTLDLIANELILNSLKHAFTGRRTGVLTVELTAGKENALCVRDNGCGLPAGFDAVKGANLGLELVLGMTRQMRGEAKFENEPTGGTRATIYFPAHHAEQTTRRFRNDADPD